MKFSCKYGIVYTSDMTFIKESSLNVNVNNNEISFTDNVTLSDIYTVEDNLGVTYTVDGVEMDSMTAVFANHNVEIKANIYTAKIGDGNYTIGSSASWTPNYTTVAPIEKIMTVKDGLEVEGTTLVDVKDVTTDTMSISNFTGKTQLENAGFNVTQTYVKRYSDGTEQTTDAIASTERGIYYASVLATNGTQSIEYDVTLDFYNSNEPVEYESFGHGDSMYAVSAYYAVNSNLYSNTLLENVASYTKLKNNWGSVGYGMDLIEEAPEGVSYVSINKYVAHSNDTNNNGKSRLKTVYYNSDAEDSVLDNIKYLAINQSQILPAGPIVTEMGKHAVINVYVLPRHTQLYYDEYSKDDSKNTVLKFIHAAPYYSGDGNGIFVYGLLSANATKTKLAHNYSADWQLGLTNTQTITVKDIAENYSKFSEREVPMIVSGYPQGRNSGATANGTLKLGPLLF